MSLCQPHQQLPRLGAGRHSPLPCSSPEEWGTQKKRATCGTARAGEEATDHGAKPGFGANPDVPPGSEPFHLCFNFNSPGARSTGDLGPDLHAPQQLPTNFPGFQAYPCGSAPGPPPRPLLPPFTCFVPLLGFAGCCGVVSRGWTCRESAPSPPAPWAAGLRYTSSTALRFMAGRNTICLHSRLYGKCIISFKKRILQNVYILLMPRVYSHPTDLAQLLGGEEQLTGAVPSHLAVARGPAGQGMVTAGAVGLQGIKRAWEREQDWDCSGTGNATAHDPQNSSRRRIRDPRPSFRKEEGATRQADAPNPVCIPTPGQQGARSRS